MLNFKINKPITVGIFVAISLVCYFSLDIFRKDKYFDVVRSFELKNYLDYGYFQVLQSFDGHMVVIDYDTHKLYLATENSIQYFAREFNGHYWSEKKLYFYANSTNDIVSYVPITLDNTKQEDNSDNNNWAISDNTYLYPFGTYGDGTVKYKIIYYFPKNEPLLKVGELISIRGDAIIGMIEQKVFVRYKKQMLIYDFSIPEQPAFVYQTPEIPECFYEASFNIITLIALNNTHFAVGCFVEGIAVFEMKNNTVSLERFIPDVTTTKMRIWNEKLIITDGNSYRFYKIADILSDKDKLEYQTLSCSIFQNWCKHEPTKGFEIDYQHDRIYELRLEKLMIYDLTELK